MTFLSDFGQVDEFVGVVKSVLRRLAPEAAVVDLTHEVAPQDVKGAALALERALPWLAPGVVLAVVDPGVGTSRRGVALEPAAPGRGGSRPGDLVFVGPDNGLLLPALRALGGVGRAVALDRRRLPPSARVGPGRLPGPTFDGRDLFAPAVARLCTGADLTELGVAIDPAGLVSGPEIGHRQVEGGVAGEVLWVDRYGNAQLAIGPEELGDAGRPAEVETVEVEMAGGRVETARRVGGFGDLAPGELGLVVDSSGLLALSLDRRSAARHLGLGAGDEVVLRPLR
ncbi:MAG: SAM hydrolase/SAM-dependent halogenase family protein [Acidimicrobiales bacterium]